jgi:hypothetical protein
VFTWVALRSLLIFAFVVPIEIFAMGMLAGAKASLWWQQSLVALAFAVIVAPLCEECARFFSAKGALDETRRIDIATAGASIGLAEALSKTLWHAQSISTFAGSTSPWLFAITASVFTLCIVPAPMLMHTVQSARMATWRGSSRSPVDQLMSLFCVHAMYNFAVLLSVALSSSVMAATRDPSLALASSSVIFVGLIVVMLSRLRKHARSLAEYD